MFYWKRPRLAAVTTIALLLTITLLLTIVSAFVSPSVAAAHSPLSDDIRRDLPPDPGGDNGSNNGDPGTTPAPGGGSNPPSTGGQQPSSGGGSGGVAPPATENGLITPVVYPWPPPNAIVLHAATPIQLSQAGSGLRVYFISRDGTSTIGPFFDDFSILAHTYQGDPVTLYTGFNPGTGKPVTIDYLPAEKKLRVSTFYADRPPHDIDKPYVFTVDAQNSITHEQW